VYKHILLHAKLNTGKTYTHIHTLLNAKLKTWKRGQGTKLTGRCPLRRCRFIMDCSPIYEGGGGGGGLWGKGGEGGGGK
jgi:hypothetical protein